MKLMEKKKIEKRHFEVWSFTEIKIDGIWRMEDSLIAQLYLIEVNFYNLKVEIINRFVCGFLKLKKACYDKIKSKQGCL